MNKIQPDNRQSEDIEANPSGAESECSNGLKEFAVGKGNSLDKDAWTVTNLHLIPHIISAMSAKRLFTKTFPKVLKYSPAFSLVEMLMALLVASLLMAALAPVMTKRVNDNVNVSGIGNTKTPAGLKCWSWEPNDLDENNYRVINDYPFDDIWYLNFAIVSGGGGGAGATLENIKDDTYDTNNTTSLKITKDMDNFTIDFMTGGGGGGGGGSAIGASKDYCLKYGKGKTDTTNHTGSDTNRILAYDNNNLCVNSYNQTGAGCVTYSYGGLSLPVCGTIGTATSACNALKSRWGGKDNWRLPTGSEQSKWTTSFAVTSVANGGLYFCDYSNGNTVRYCPLIRYQNTEFLTPYKVWSSTRTSDGQCGTSNTSYHVVFVNNGSLGDNRVCAWGSNNTGKDHGSVRCVYDPYKSLSGGGGGSGAAIEKASFDSTVREILNKKIKENIGGTIVLEKGEGGKGGDKASGKNTKADDGKDGTASCVVVKNISNVTVYKVCTMGGKKGLGADGTITSSDIGGKAGLAQQELSMDSSCYTQTSDDEATRKYFTCSGGGDAGMDGTLGAYGGRSFLNTGKRAQYFSLDSADGETLSSTSYPGAGGGGGRSVRANTISDIVTGDGGKGTDGYIKLSYVHKYDGAGGGGGGAGTLAVINNVFVGKSSTCTMKIGYGGSGGNTGADGKAGGSSSIVCSSDPTVYEVYGGKEGKAGTQASSTNNLSVGGSGGAFGMYSDSIARLVAKGEATVQKGLEGTQGGLNTNDNSYINYIQGLKSSGGRGGTSGTGKKGKCGGLTKDIICSSTETTPSVSDLLGQSFSHRDILEPTSSGIVSTPPVYGDAGSGGGGGAWYKDIGSGKGGDGLGGYICVWWQGSE